MGRGKDPTRFREEIDKIKEFEGIGGYVDIPIKEDYSLMLEEIFGSSILDKYAEMAEEVSDPRSYSKDTKLCYLRTLLKTGSSLDFKVDLSSYFPTF
jgi:hypothetical protein